jgi:toxin-antitoxin system PIN domain toxin
VIELLDSNVLVALALPTHVHHERVSSWWAARDASGFATCPITQGALLRLAMQRGHSVHDAMRLLQAISALPHHRFWPDALSYDEVRVAGVVGHRQVTDAYLAQLARHHRARLVSLDTGLLAAHTDVAVAVPES